MCMEISNNLFLIIIIILHFNISSSHSGSLVVLGTFPWDIWLIDVPAGLLPNILLVRSNSFHRGFVQVACWFERERDVEKHWNCMNLKVRQKPLRHLVNGGGSSLTITGDQDWHLKPRLI